MTATLRPAPMSDADDIEVEDCAAEGLAPLNTRRVDVMPVAERKARILALASHESLDDADRLDLIHGLARILAHTTPDVPTYTTARTVMGLAKPEVA